MLIFSYISTENINAEYLVNLSVHLLFFTEISVNMPGNFSKNNEHCVSQWQTVRAAGSRGPAAHQSAKDQLYCTSVSRGPAVHQLAEDQQYCASVSRGPAVYKSAEDQQYISKQRTSGTSVSRGPAVHQSPEDQQYISQHWNSSKSGSRGPTLHQLAGDQQNCASVIRGPAVH